MVELIVASAIGVILMTGLTSVILTSVQAGVTASSRVEASSQIRNFELDAYDDFARSAMPSPVGCAATVTSPCTTQPIVLVGLQVPNSGRPLSSPPPSYTVSYKWIGSGIVDRLAPNAGPVHAATGVSAFTWYIDSADQTVVISLTVKVQSYAESQTLKFHPRLVP